MATLAPTTRCMICDQPYEYEAIPKHRKPWEPVIMGPTNWQQKPHSCPPGSVEAWKERILKSDKE